MSSKSLQVESSIAGGSFGTFTVDVVFGAAWPNDGNGVISPWDFFADNSGIEREVKDGCGESTEKKPERGRRYRL